MSARSPSTRATGKRRRAPVLCLRQFLSAGHCLVALWLMLLCGSSLRAATSSQVVINEILYHPDPNSTGEEYVELHNRGDSAVDLSGWILDGGINFNFPAGTRLAEKGYLIVARDAAAARAFYQVTNVMGNFSGRLNNAGDTLRLKNSSNPRLIIDSVTYTDHSPWPADADGGGASLELFIPESDNADPLNWGTGQPYSPGRANAPAHAGAGAIVINEIMYLPQREELREKFDAAHPGTYQEVGDDEFGEYVELYNRSGGAVDVSGWKFTDGFSYVMPVDLTIAAGEYLVVAAHPEAVRARFGITSVMGPYLGTLSDGGERITLRDTLGRIVDTVRYGDQPPWPAAPDDLGYSLECIDPKRDNSAPDNWRSSRRQLGGAIQQPWQAVSISGVALSDQLFVHLNGAGEWLIDQVEVHPAAGGANLLPNGSFEPDTAGWTLSGNHAPSKRIIDTSSEGEGSLLMVATGAGDADTNHVKSAVIPGLIIGESYTITCRVLFRKGADTLTLGFLDGGFAGTAHTSGGIHNLSKDWSDTANPSYGWSYRQRNGSLISARVTRWRSSDLGSTQPAWTAGGTTGAPGWCRSTGSSSLPGAPHVEYDFPVGAVMSHGPSEVWWTAPSDQRVTLSGGVWLLRHLGRSQHWYIKLNGTELSAGDLLSVDTSVSSRAPQSFETGTGGKSALVVEIHAGDVLKFGALPLAPNRTDDYVGYDISIAFGQSTAPPVNKPPLAGFVGRGTPGSQNSVSSDVLPPFVQELAHAPEKPSSTNSVLVTARIQSGVPLTSVKLKTSINIATNEIWFDMVDDGTHGDGAAGDGIYGAVVPAQKSQTLVHYRITATDSLGGVTTFPYPDDPSPTQAYFHYDSEIKTGSTLFHLFITSKNVAILDADPNSEDSVDCSLVIDHIAYPHIGMNYRGRGSRNNPKRPRKFKFNKQQPYRGTHSYDTMYSVPLEQQIAFEVFDSAGVENLEHELVRLHINGAFWGWYIGFESPTASWLSKHRYDPEGEVYKARSVETANQWKNSDLYHNQITTDYDYWGAYNKKVRPLEPPTELRELVNALNDLTDAELLPWLDAHLDVDQWFKRWALNICMNIDDFSGHNFYMFLPGGPGGRWKMLAYDFDSGLTFGRVGPLRALYGDGGNGDNPAWQRNKLYQRVSANPTLKRIYLLTLRKMLSEVMRLDVIFPRIDELFKLTAPDRTADLARWATVRSSTTEAKEVLTSQRRSLSNYLAQASIGLPSRDKAPVVSLPGGDMDPSEVIRITTAPGWQAYFTLDGSDPRLSIARRPYTEPIQAPTNAVVIKAAAIPVGQQISSGNWTDLGQQVFSSVPRPRLMAMRVGPSLQLSWSVQFTNQVVEAASDVSGPWVGLTGAPTQVGEEFRAVEELSGSTRFFRLR